MKINKVWVFVFVALVFLLVVVWALKASRKKKAEDKPVGPPGAVSDVKAKPVDGIPRNSTVSEYTAIVNEVGLIVNFKTPSSSGVPGDPSIKSYKITLRNSITTDTKEYLTSTTFIAGYTESLTTYKWKDSPSNGIKAGDIASELFISSSLFNGLVDGQSYIIGIKAINSIDLSSVSESSSAAILYNTCKLGLQGACGWSNADTSGRGQATVISASSSSSATSGSFSGTAAVVGAPCDPSTTKAPNMLYKIDSQSVCAAAGCETGYIFENGGCTRRIVAGDPCGTIDGYNYYYTYDSTSGAKLTDANGDILTCDNTHRCPGGFFGKLCNNRINATNSSLQRTIPSMTSPLVLLDNNISITIPLAYYINSTYPTVANNSYMFGYDNAIDSYVTYKLQVNTDNIRSWIKVWEAGVNSGSIIRVTTNCTVTIGTTTYTPKWPVSGHLAATSTILNNYYKRIHIKSDGTLAVNMYSFDVMLKAPDGSEVIIGHPRLDETNSASFTINLVDGTTTLV